MITIKINYTTKCESELSLAQDAKQFICGVGGFRYFFDSRYDWEYEISQVPGGVLLVATTDERWCSAGEVIRDLMETMHSGYGMNDDNFKYAIYDDDEEEGFTNCRNSEIDMSDCCDDFYDDAEELTLSFYSVDKLYRDAEEDSVWQNVYRVAHGDEYCR